MSLTERVDDAFLLLLNALEATDPLSTIAHGANSGGPVWALESWNEEVPCSWKTPDTDIEGGFEESKRRTSSASITCEGHTECVISPFLQRPPGIVQRFSRHVRTAASELTNGGGQNTLTGLLVKRTARAF